MSRRPCHGDDMAEFVADEGMCYSPRAEIKEAN